VEGSAAPISVVVADDDVLLREGLASLLDRSGFCVVGRSGDASDLPALVHELEPDLAIIDIRMPPTHENDGLEAATKIRAETPGAAIVVLSAYAELEEALELLSSGDRTGYLLKSRVRNVSEFIEALRSIVNGESIVDRALVEELVSARRLDDPLDDLTPREREVLAQMAEGRSNAGIAHQLWLAEGTVEKHVHRILTKLHLPDTEDDHRRVLAVLTFLQAR
jgi:DNA-binding NarL/FixJ family response regulator